VQSRTRRRKGCTAQIKIGHALEIPATWMPRPSAARSAILSDQFAVL
jgi:hypothetical protein